jgi:hypothetical protein
MVRPLSPGGGWRRYRFHANEKDPRPIQFPPPGPYWLSGWGVGPRGYAVVVAWLPEHVPLQDWWPDAEQVEFTEEGPPRWFDRFPKPDWYTGPEHEE